MTLSWGKEIVVYHGSGFIIKQPELDRGVGEKDFGGGFYLTLDKEQAEDFIKSLFNKSNNRVKNCNKAKVNVYSLEVGSNLKLKNLTKQILNG